MKGRAEPLVREASNVRNAILREAERSDLVVMGASATPGAGNDASLFGAIPEAIAGRARPTVVVVKTRETIGRTTFEQLAEKAETLAAADRAAEEARAIPAASSAGSASRTTTTPSSPTCAGWPTSRSRRG